MCPLSVFMLATQLLKVQHSKWQSNCFINTTSQFYDRIFNPSNQIHFSKSTLLSLHLHYESFYYESFYLFNYCYQSYCLGDIFNVKLEEA